MENVNEFIDNTPDSASGDENVLLSLNFEESRVLGSLIEKELTTPEYYPLTLNSLVFACNQKIIVYQNPTWMNLRFLRPLKNSGTKTCTSCVELIGSRVPKFQHNAEKELDLIKAERALIAELLNRGPQTTGELTTRASRMFSFDGLQDVEDTLQDMMERSPSLVGIMDPRPGQRKRWFHKFGPPPKLENLDDGSSVYVPAPDQRLDKVEEIMGDFKDLKEEVEALRYQLRELSDEYRNFRKQFE